MIEEWRPVVGYEGIYEVSSLGRIKSILRRQGAKVGRLLTPQPKKNKKRKGEPYWAVTLKVDCVQKSFDVAFLVITAFVGPRPEGLEINHIDGDKSRNWSDNLEWLTPEENKKKARDMGLYRNAEGANHPLAKLTEEQARAIWAIRNDGYREEDVARAYGVSYCTVGDVWRKKRYTDVLVGDPRDPNTRPNRWSPRKEFEEAA
jgi:hypothetical protein